MVFSLTATALGGILLSIYAFYVENKNRKEKSYKPVCDITEKVSCTKAFSSQYGKILGISNSAIGIFFYLLILILSITNQIKIIFYFSVLAFTGTIYLSYISYFRLKNFCLVCTGIYIINFLLLFLSYYKI